jgi:hypothetical protein
MKLKSASKQVASIGLTSSARGFERGIGVCPDILAMKGSCDGLITPEHSGSRTSFEMMRNSNYNYDINKIFPYCNI